MTYRVEVQGIIDELRDDADKMLVTRYHLPPTSKMVDRANLLMRRAEVLSFLINHPDQIAGVLDA